MRLTFSLDILKKMEVNAERNIHFEPFVSNEDPPVSTWHLFRRTNFDGVEEEFPIPFTKEEFGVIEAAYNLGQAEHIIKATGSWSGPEREYSLGRRIPWGHALKSRRETLNGVPETMLKGIRGTSKWLGSEYCTDDRLPQETRDTFTKMKILLDKFGVAREEKKSFFSRLLRK